MNTWSGSNFLHHTGSGHSPDLNPNRYWPKEKIWQKWLQQGFSKNISYERYLINIDQRRILPLFIVKLPKR
jgi:hypothetical protein